MLFRHIKQLQLLANGIQKLRLSNTHLPTCPHHIQQRCCCQLRQAVSLQQLQQQPVQGLQQQLLLFMSPAAAALQLISITVCSNQAQRAGCYVVTFRINLQPPANFLQQSSSSSGGADMFVALLRGCLQDDAIKACNLDVVAANCTTTRT
jgi:hypothetical protein